MTDTTISNAIEAANAARDEYNASADAFIADPTAGIEVMKAYRAKFYAAMNAAMAAVDNAGRSGAHSEAMDTISRRYRDAIA